jgi:hypothetical protein
MAWIKRQKARCRGESMHCLVNVCDLHVLLSWYLLRDDGMMCTLLVVCIDNPPADAECLDHALAAHMHPWAGRRGLVPVRCSAPSSPPALRTLASSPLSAPLFPAPPPLP